MTSRSGLRFLLWTLWLVLSCGSELLRPVPAPANAEAMDGPVGKQYEERRARLDDLLAGELRGEDLAEAYGALGQWFQAYRRFPQAEIAYSNARGLAPRDKRWAYYSGLLQVRQGRSDEARLSFQEVLKSEPGDVPTLVRLGELELGAGHLDRAEEHLEQALAIAPGCVRAMVSMAELARERGQAQRELAMLDRALMLQPDSKRVRYVLALAYRRAGMRERAEAQLAVLGQVGEAEQLRMADPLVAELALLDVGSRRLVKQAREAMMEGRHREALRQFRAASEINSDLSSSALGEARALAALGRSEAATEAFTSSLERFPNDPALLFFASSHFRRRGLPEKAEVLLRRLLVVKPTGVAAMGSLSELALQRGDRVEALQWIERACALDPDDVSLARRHAAVLVGLDRFEEARSSLEDALRRSGSHRGLELALAHLLAVAPETRVRDGARAFALARKAYRNSEGLDAAEILVMAVAEQGRFAVASSCQASLATAARDIGRRDLAERLELREALYRRHVAVSDSEPYTEASNPVYFDLSTPGCEGLLSSSQVEQSSEMP